MPTTEMKVQLIFNSEFHVDPQEAIKIPQIWWQDVWSGRGGDLILVWTIATTLQKAMGHKRVSEIA